MRRQGTDRRRGPATVLPACGALGAACLVAAGASGESSWLLPTNGAFSSPVNWSSGVPGPRDDAVFGAIEGTAPFIAVVPSALSVAGLRVTNQSPVLHGLGVGSLAIGSSFTILGSNAAPPTLRLTGIEIDGPNVSGAIGVTLGTGHLRVGADAVLQLDRCTVGQWGGHGTITIEAGGVLRGGGAPNGWLVGFGSGGEGAIDVQAGGLFDLGGDDLDIGRTIGQGDVEVGAGALLDLNGGVCRVGSGVGSIYSGTGTLTLHGTLEDADRVEVGNHATGVLHLEPGASMIAPLSIGLDGTGSVQVSGSHALTDVHFGTPHGPSGVLHASGAATSLSVELLAADLGSTPIGMVTVDDGALATIALARGRMLALSATGGAEIVVERTEPIDSLVVSASDAVSLVDLPPMTLGKGDGLTLHASGGASITIDSLVGNEGSSASIDLTNNGMLNAIGGIDAGACTLVIGSGSRLLTGGFSKSASLTILTLPRTEAAIVSNGPAVIGGDLLIQSGGWSPPGGMEVPLISASSLTLTGGVGLPSFFGFPTLLRVDDRSAALRIFDHVDGIDAGPPLRMNQGTSVAVPVTVTVDGILYDVSSRVTWSVADPLIADVIPGDATNGGERIAAIGPGTTLATAHFGPASVDVEVIVTAGSWAVRLVSGIGLSYGNGDSGSTDPGVFGSDSYVRPGACSDDGTIVAFATEASNLLPGDLAGWHTLVADLSDRHFESPGAPEGSDPPVWSGIWPRVSGNGRYVVLSGSTGTTTQVFVADRVAGTIEQVSLSTSGGTPSQQCWDGWVSNDGRFVLFRSLANNLVPGDTNGRVDVFLRDRLMGTTTRVSRAPDGSQLAVDSEPLDLSADGRYAFFRRLHAGWQVGYRYDRITDSIDLATANAAGSEPQASVLEAHIAADGRWLTFLAVGPELFVPGPTPLGAQVYQRDLITGALRAVSMAEDGLWASAPIDAFAVTGDARFVGLATRAVNLAAGSPPNGLRKLVRIDGRNRTAVLLSSPEGTPFNADVDGAIDIADGGQRIFFSSEASNVTPLDLAGHHDVFAIDRPVDPVGDFNGDGSIGAADLAMLLGAWSSDRYDLDGDGIVGAGDVAILVAGWQSM